MLFGFFRRSHLLILAFFSGGNCAALTVLANGIESKAQNPRDIVATRIFIQGFIGWLQTVRNETNLS